MLSHSTEQVDSLGVETISVVSTLINDLPNPQTKRRMMEIYQINDYQLNVLKSNNSGQKYVSLVPDSEKDGDTHEMWLQHTKWNKELVEQGFMMELSTENDEFVRRMETAHERKYSVFRLTPLAIAMFTPVLIQGSEPHTFRNVADTIH
jgi:hypothetical protein